MTRTTACCRIWSANCPPVSDEFRRRWGAHDVRTHGAGAKTFHHDVVGDLELFYESVDMISDPGLTLTLYVAEPASPTAHAWTCSRPGPPSSFRNRRPATIPST